MSSKITLQEAMRNKTHPYIIGETAYNHEGDFEYLKKMVDKLAELKVNAIKFHLLLELNSYIQKNHPLKQELKKWIFTKEQWAEIIKYSNEKGLEVIALCDDVESIEFINKTKLPVAGIELHAVCINDYFMLKEIIKTDNIIILGVGGTEIDEITYTVEHLKKNGKKINELLFMYGFQNYPTDYTQINLQKMNKLAQLYNVAIGYADHTKYDDKNNVLISALGAANGFNILEKHYTPDFGVERIDFHAAVGDEQFIEIGKKMEMFLKIAGTGTIAMSKSEQKYGNVGPMKKAIVAKKTIKKGEELTLENLWFKRTREESSIRQSELPKLIGLKAKQNILEDTPISYENVEFSFQTTDLSSFTHKEADK